jgi:hypothetical protein
MIHSIVSRFSSLSRFLYYKVSSKSGVPNPSQEQPRKVFGLVWYSLFFKGLPLGVFPFKSFRTFPHGQCGTLRLAPYFLFCIVGRFITTELSEVTAFSPKASKKRFDVHWASDSQYQQLSRGNVALVTL